MVEVTKLRAIRVKREKEFFEAKSKKSKKRKRVSFRFQQSD